METKEVEVKCEQCEHEWQQQIEHELGKETIMVQCPDCGKMIEIELQDM